MPRRLILLFVAVVISLGVFFVAQQWLHSQMHGSQKASVTASGPPPTRVLVATGDFPAGSLLRADSLRWQNWPAGDGGVNYVTAGKGAPVDYAGAVVRSRLSTGEPVAPGEIVKPGERGFMAAVLTPGSRAITVNVTPNTSMAGFVVPGDRVDLILTLTAQSNDKTAAPRHLSETVLRDLRVVGMDQSLSDDRGSAKTGKDDKSAVVVPKTATLEVTPKQAEMIAVAADVGVLSLSLRSLGRPDGAQDDAAITHTWDSDIAPGILGGPAPGAVRSRSRARAAPTSSTVVVVRGNVASDVVIPGHVITAGLLTQ